MKQAELKTEAEITRELKAYALKVADELPERLLKGDKVRHKPRPTRASRANRFEAQAEQSYDQLEGVWRDWLEVAKRFEHKAQAHDRLDLRHTIIVAFADQQARNERLGKPDLSFYGMLRIASHCVADYWRQQRRQLTILSLNTELQDEEGNTVELIDTLADDSVDIEAWLESSTWELGYPKRLVEIAYKLDNGKTLSGYERLYLCRYRHKHQKRLF